ncbi:hypothetical protein DMC47_35240 [Nostoc sp. 3335mG]|nr:hypothetical protein DMC47_35240 [Nostoc sp. 3335mG]
MGATLPLESEVTPIGSQVLVPGVTPITSVDRLALRAVAPLRSAKPQKPADHGLFDLNARDQLDLFAPSGD